MNIKTYLDPKRIWFLLQRDFKRQWKDFLITMGAFCGFFLIILILNSKTGRVDYSTHYLAISLILFVIGFIYTSRAFREAHKKLLNHDWLMLPASTLEKFINKLVLYAVIFPVVSVAVYSVFTLIAKLVIQVFLGEYYPGFNPLDSTVWQMVGHYFIAQSIFLLGAAWFRKNNFIMTIIALVLFSMIITILSSLIGWIVFNDYFWTLVRADFNISMDMSAGFDMGQFENFGENVFTVMKVIYFGLMAPVCWVGAWLKLREVEVKDGV